MPLPPGGNAPWPPQNLATVHAAIAEWDAWYTGDQDKLAATYGGAYGSSGAHPFFQSESGTGIRGRVRSAITRWFWGSSGERNGGGTRTKLHVPMASDIAALSADLLFGDPITITGEDTAAHERLEELADDGMHATLLEAAEIAAALSGVYLRVVWDRTLSPAPWLTAVHPDAAIPEWRMGRLSAVTFWRVLSDDGRTVVRHLERHEPGAILHGLYSGDQDTLGTLIPLTESAATSHLADSVIDGDRIPTGATGLTAVYIPNVRPNRIWRNTPDAAYLGRSDYAGVEPQLDALDECWSSWMRDLRHGKSMLIVPNEYLTNHGPGGGASFTAEREIWQGINAMGDPDGAPSIEQVQFQIRVAEHQATMLELVQGIARGCGYSPQSFGIAGDVAATATEVVARERRSYSTRDRKIRYWRPAIATILQTLLEVDRAVFGTGIIPERPSIEFAPAAATDPEAAARTLQLLDAAGAISTRQKVITLHPDWGAAQVDEEVQAIQGPALEDPATFTGAPSTEGGPEGDPEDDPEDDGEPGDGE